ncbi:Fasciclin-1 [Orchesella cincta]|uniref:Fasciclin-1 n=1 Tax=Orchesella cincta TaxID=48709 RepID=A0A1D2N0J9_ORCCI|nr:Fasciclin-1 [Orchesella cincta]
MPELLINTVPGSSFFLNLILQRSPFQIQTALRNKKLFFNYISSEGRKTLYVEGGGVNATITQPDVGATNGVIHMIDRILGYADQDIYEKLRTDPMLQMTFRLSSQDDFNHQFKDINRRFTLFAPSNVAWEKIYRIAPSEYKKLTMGSFGYHVSRIIQRHTIVNRVYTIEQLRELSTNASEQAYPIQAVHGLLKVVHKDDVDWKGRDRFYRQYGTSPNNVEGDFSPAFDYTVTWANERAQVVRPNIICTNGIIHIIDTVLMKPDDVTVTYTASSGSMPSVGISSIYVIPSFSLLLIFSNIFTGLL